MNRRNNGSFYRNDGSSELWVLSELRVIVIVDRRNCGQSDLWVVGLMGRFVGRRNYGPTPVNSGKWRINERYNDVASLVDKAV